MCARWARSRSRRSTSVAYPLATLGPDVLREILRGGADAAAAAGAAVVGGHSIDDPEPKYGMAVTGVVAPDAVLTNAGGREGDALVLTKPLGAAEIDAAAVPAIDGVLELLADDAVVAGGSRRNRADAETFTRWGGSPEPRCRLLTEGRAVAVEPVIGAQLQPDPTSTTS